MPLVFLFFSLLAASLPGAARAAALPDDESAAVILAYQRIGEDSMPDASLRTDLFEAHLQEILHGGYTVMALPAVIAALKSGEKLPARTLVITFEGAYRSALENAIPRLRAHNLPFTVFFAGSHADAETGPYMNWNELRALGRDKNVTLGILPDSYIHLVGLDRPAILEQVNRARLRYREVLNDEPRYFSYPYGEIALDVKSVITEQGFDAAFGIQSGSAAPASDLMALPRFTMTDIYGDMERFRLVATALPLPVTDIEPADPALRTDKPVIGFTLPPQLAEEAGKLSCFISGQPAPDLQILGENRVEIRLAESLTEERTRVNCTMPVAGEDENEIAAWRWFGMLLFRRDPESQPLPEGPTPQQAELQ